MSSLNDKYFNVVVNIHSHLGLWKFHVFFSCLNWIFCLLLSCTVLPIFLIYFLTVFNLERLFMQETEGAFPRIQKYLPLSPKQFYKPTETTSRAFKTVFPFNKIEILLINHQNHKSTPKNMSVFNQNLWKKWWWGSKCFRIWALRFFKMSKQNIEAITFVNTKVTLRKGFNICVNSVMLPTAKPGQGNASVMFTLKGI